ncbi:DUF1615 domain-containing protein [Methylibium sp.]|uniref:DUF1615 domain-containing protein n=1 Tax=Methylibium sp. TaxID=2067992 RepID=UPI00179C45B6|nr:DUF1615 domain-containing protein [Methylibium sp.]MBA3590809.1 DUF1615 domain-containing protein [Methylibium sp.]
MPCRAGDSRASGRRVAQAARWRRPALWLAAGCLAVLAGCATQQTTDPGPPLDPARGRALITRLLPPATPEPAAWATDIYAAFAAMEIAPTPENICAVIAVTEQESGFRALPVVPNLAAITWREIDRRAERAGVPKLIVRAALAVPSPNGKSYSERIDAARTEGELSRIFEDFIGMVPMGQRLFAGWNPVRTGGPMQVSIAFAEQHAADKAYPYPVGDSLRREVFTRRGGMYFGIAHLLDYPAPYNTPLYRFADFNAGHYASRNAAFQNAVSTASGIPLALDGDLVLHGPEGAERPGSTELATRVLGKHLNLSDAAIRRALEQGTTQDFDRTQLYERVFALADPPGRPLPRAMLPNIRLQSPKITRKLTTAWFANRVNERYGRCRAREAA